jgi:alanine racemase
MDLCKEVNIKTVLQNIKTVRSHLEKRTKVCAVVKANAYGLGDVHISKGIQNNVDFFAVARLYEALRLRAVGISKPILLFGLCEDYKTAIENNITVTIPSVHEMHRAVKASQDFGKLCVHIKVNTGMNRFGITSPWHLRSILSIAEKSKFIEIGGLYTHFSHECTSPEGTAQVDRQLNRFAPYRAIIRRTFPRAIIHAACSGAAHYRPAQFDMVRIGKAMYGGFTGYKTAVTITAKIVATQNLLKGQSVGYGAKFTAKENMTIGIVACGYAVAGFLLLRGVDSVYLNKKECKILGSVCMDNMAIDISGIKEPLSKTVTIIGESQNCKITDLIDKIKISGATILTTLDVG